MPISPRVLLAALLTLSLPACSTKPPRPAPPTPATHSTHARIGNIFVLGQDVSVNLGGTGLWQANDYDHNPVGEGDLVNGRANLGRLPIGYYEIRRKGATDRITAGVVAPLLAPTPDDTPIASDVGMSWFYEDEARRKGSAELCTLAGIRWVRDRMSWAELQSARNAPINETNRYDLPAKIQQDAGLQVLQVNHQSPPWANPEGKRFPLDLRDAYSFYKTIATRWKGLVPAIEPWNEADIDVFGGHTGAEMASMQKASYLGLKAGNPDVIACLNVFAKDNVPHLDDVKANEVWPYFDTYNLHHYIPWDKYPQAYAHHRATSAGKPMWVTEFALPVKWDNEKTKEPTDMWLRAQAQRIGKVFASSLHEGPDKSFYFILGDYVERQTQYGIVHQDLTPRPAYLALAAAGRMLAGAKPAGKIKSADPNTVAFAFHALPDGEEKTVVVAWAAKDTSDWTSPAKIERVIDGMGRLITIGNSGRVRLGPLPMYVVLASNSASKLNLDPPAPRPPLLTGHASPIVLQPLSSADHIVLKDSAYRITPDIDQTIPIAAYNFSSDPAKGELSIQAPQGWTVTPTTIPLTLAPNERKQISITLRAPNSSTPESLKIQGHFGPSNSPVLSIRVLPQLPDPPATAPAAPIAPG